MMASLGKPERGDDEIDELDADERHDDAAEAVDEQVAPQQRRGADRPIGHALQASGIRATMISALKITADRMALFGVVSCMTLSACNSG